MSSAGTVVFPGKALYWAEVLLCEYMALILKQVGNTTRFVIYIQFLESYLLHGFASCLLTLSPTDFGGSYIWTKAIHPTDFSGT